MDAPIGPRKKESAKGMAHKRLLVKHAAKTDAPTKLSGEESVLGTEQRGQSAVVKDAQTKQGREASVGDTGHQRLIHLGKSVHVVDVALMGAEIQSPHVMT